jgi:hypothetical protein
VAPLCRSAPPSPCHHQAAAAPLRDLAVLLLLLVVVVVVQAESPHPQALLQHPQGSKHLHQASGLHLQRVPPQQQQQ